MDTHDKRELISALVDGQVDAAGLETAVCLAATDPDARDAWDAFHLIGDVMRSGELASAAPSSDFLVRLHERLPPSALVSLVPDAGVPMRQAGVPGREAANDGGAGWRWVAGFASLAAVGAVIWGLASPQSGRDAAPVQLAATPAPTASTAVPAPLSLAGEVMLRDPRLDELMAAHRQLGGATALQMPAGFLRNATFEGPAKEGR